MPAADAVVKLVDHHGLTLGNFARFPLPRGWDFIDHQTSKRELRRKDTVGIGEWATEGDGEAYKPPVMARRMPDGRLRLEFPALSSHVYVATLAPLLDKLAAAKVGTVSVRGLESHLGW